MAMDTTFSDDEKRFLLAEMIKVSQTNVNDLVQFVKAHAIGYKFWSIVVPQGRNLEQCVQAAENMLEVPMPRSSLERASVSTTSGGPPTRRTTANVVSSMSSPLVGDASVVMSPMPPVLQAGQFSPIPTTIRGTMGANIPIQPRPAPVADIQVAPPPSTPPEGPPVKKRRGRPPRKPIDYSLPPVAPKPIAPLVAHSGGLPNHAQPPYPSPHGVAGVPFLPTGTPPTEGSMPSTPTHVSTPSSANAQAISGAGAGTAKGRKRARQPTTESNLSEAGERNPSSDVALQSAALQKQADLNSTTMTPPSAHADASTPRYPPTDDRTPSMPPQGSALPPLAQGEPSLRPNNSTKRDRPAPLTP